MKLLSHKYSLIVLLAGIAILTPSCFKDLDTIPLDEDVTTAATVYNNPAAYKQVLAKIYAGLALSGQQGPAGAPDIAGIDEGFSTYLRQYWKAQELPTDEAVIGWNDGTLQTYHRQDWDAQGEFIGAMYNRIFYQISLCNEYLRETTDGKLSDRGVSQSLKDEIAVYRAEARFMRALSYWHALDLFRQVPFVTEQDKVGAFFPKQASAQELFTFIESELKAVEPQLKAPRTNEYGRADQAAAWTLLAKLYLNANVYTGQGKYTEAVEYSKKVINAGYTLDPKYQNLFLADNNTAKGIIFPVVFDGIHARTWGGMTFVVHAAVGGSMKVAEFGIDGGWGGTRTTSAFVKKFPSTSSGSIIVAPKPGGDYALLNIPGGYQGWKPEDNNTALGSFKNDKVYEGYLNIAEATELKFALGGWDQNWGDNGGDGTLDPGGNNIPVAPGFYRMTVNLNDLTYKIFKTDWGLIGSATAGGWGSDQNMTYNDKDKSWTITADLTAGEIKFRANDDWALNYGDKGADAILEEGGDNIAISSAGTYIIKLYLGKPNYTYSIELASFDSRAMFHTAGQSLEIADVSQFTEGYAVTKFKNVTSKGVAGSNPTWVDTDFPMFRIEDVYLMYAEAVLRGGTGGSKSEAVNYVNLVRQRAYGGPAGNITEAQLNLDFILDERARELYWEGHRRTDLVRFGKLTDGDYVWAWKGGVAQGAKTQPFRNVFPIPASDIGANPNLKQNQGY